MILQRFHTAFLFLCLIFLFVSSHAEQYRIATQEDFNELKESTFLPGDKILFKRGITFIGMFTPTGEGTAEAPIIVDSYGKGNRPVINAGGNHKAGFLLRNPSFWEVNGLEITNPYKNQNLVRDAHNAIIPEKKLFGILVLANGEEKTYEHVYINDCYIHDVNDMVGHKDHGGIHVRIEDLKESRFHDLRITGNRVVRVGGVGIANQSSSARIFTNITDVDPQNLWTRVYVADNFVDQTGRNNIIARVSKDAIYERNVLANSSRGDTGHSIFCFSTDGIRIQYNEAYGNVGKDRDRGGYDADYNCINTFIQYNYSHDNEWFCGIMRKPQQNIIIRYNVSQNDRSGIYYYGFKIAMFAENIHIYNNTHYVAEGLEVEVFPFNTPPLSCRFENNIFYFQGEGNWGEEIEGTNSVFKNNIYYNIAVHPSDEQARTADPGFVNPGKAGTHIDLKTMKALSGYHLSSESPILSGATQIEENGGQNLLKEKLPSGKNGYGAL